MQRFFYFSPAGQTTREINDGFLPFGRKKQSLVITAACLTECLNLIVITAGKTQVLQGMPEPPGKNNNAFNADDFQPYEQPFSPNQTTFYMATTGMAEHLCGFKTMAFAGQYLIEILEELHILPAVR